MQNLICSKVDCKKVANFRCPTCLKLGISDGVHFCSQDCFRQSWDSHKLQHKQARSVENIKENNSHYTYSGLLRPFPYTPKRIVPDTIVKPDYATHPEGVSFSENRSKSSGVIEVLNKEEITKLKKACKLGREVLDVAAKAIKVGITTDEIDRLVHQACIERDCYPSPLNYYKYPKSCCTSVNEIICHGIPDERPLEDGDIVNVDITVYHDGFHGDLNETFFVGNVDEASKKLVKVTYECLSKAIELVKPGVKYRDIGNVIQKIANQNGVSVVKSFCGHGIHKVFHTLPNVPHYAKNKTTGVMQPGHSFTIEPMINQGTWRDIIWPDEWTAATQDGKRSAQFEHTLLVTETGCEILTIRNDPVFKSQPHFMDNL